MLLKENDDTIGMAASCSSDKLSSNLSGELINENNDTDMLHDKLCSMPKSTNSSENSPSTSPFPTVNVSPENIVPYKTAYRQTCKDLSNDTCHKDEVYKLEPKPASHE